MRNTNIQRPFEAFRSPASLPSGGMAHFDSLNPYNAKLHWEHDLLLDDVKNLDAKVASVRRLKLLRDGELALLQAFCDVVTELIHLRGLGGVAVNRQGIPCHTNLGQTTKQLAAELRCSYPTFMSRYKALCKAGLCAPLQTARTFKGPLLSGASFFLQLRKLGEIAAQPAAQLRFRAYGGAHKAKPMASMLQDAQRQRESRRAPKRVFSKDKDMLANGLRAKGSSSLAAVIVNSYSSPLVTQAIPAPQAHLERRVQRALDRAGLKLLTSKGSPDRSFAERFARAAFEKGIKQSQVRAAIALYARTRPGERADREVSDAAVLMARLIRDTFGRTYWADQLQDYQAELRQRIKVARQARRKAASVRVEAEKKASTRVEDAVTAAWEKRFRSLPESVVQECASILLEEILKVPALLGHSVASDFAPASYRFSVLAQTQSGETMTSLWQRLEQVQGRHQQERLEVRVVPSPAWHGVVGELASAGVLQAEEAAGFQKANISISTVVLRLNSSSLSSDERRKWVTRLITSAASTKPHSREQGREERNTEVGSIFVDGKVACIGNAVL